MSNDPFATTRFPAPAGVFGTAASVAEKVPTTRVAEKVEIVTLPTSLRTTFVPWRPTVAPQQQLSPVGLVDGPETVRMRRGELVSGNVPVPVTPARLMPMSRLVLSPVIWKFPDALL